MYTLYYLLFNTVFNKKIVQHVSNYVTVHLQGLIYYTSYTLMVLIKIYKLGRQHVVN